VIRPGILTASNVKSILEKNLANVEEDDENGLYILEETGYRVLH